MSTLRLDRLTLAEIAPMMRAMSKDKSYRKTPVGVMVGRYVRWFRNEYGATENSIRDYETILGRMALALADREVLDVTIEDLRDVIDLWSAQSPRTRQKVTSVVRAFWAWMEDESFVPDSPARKIRRPKAERRVGQMLPLTARPALLETTSEPRDRLGLWCLLGLGLRREELSGVMFRDFDEQRGLLKVFGKGRKERVLPMPAMMLVELRLCLSADLPWVGRPPRGSDYLLYPMDRRANGKNAEGFMTYIYRARPADKPSNQATHRWWYRRAQIAGLVEPGVTSGMNMHRARHSFAMEIRRVAGIDAAQHMLGHSDISTTVGIYGHYSPDDLQTAMDRYSEWLAASSAADDISEDQ